MILRRIWQRARLAADDSREAELLEAERREAHEAPIHLPEVRGGYRGTRRPLPPRPRGPGANGGR